MTSNLPERAVSSLSYKVMLRYKEEFTMLVVLSRYYTDGKWISHIGVTSSQPTYVSSEFIELILKTSIDLQLPYI